MWKAIGNSEMDYIWSDIIINNIISIYNPKEYFIINEIFIWSEQKKWEDSWSEMYFLESFKMYKGFPTQHILRLTNFILLFYCITLANYLEFSHGFFIYH